MKIVYVVYATTARGVTMPCAAFDTEDEAKVDMAKRSAAYPMWSFMIVKARHVNDAPDTVADDQEFDVDLYYQQGDTK